VRFLVSRFSQVGFWFLEPRAAKVFNASQSEARPPRRRTEICHRISHLNSQSPHVYVTPGPPGFWFPDPPGAHNLFLESELAILTALQSMVKSIAEHSRTLFFFVHRASEWVTGYRRRAAKVGGALYDGAPSAWVAEVLNTRFKAGIQTIIARTAGRIMASTGIPGTFSGQGGPRRRQMGT
jgi:hypothetical protein